jgi:hypothetical protein
MMNKGEREAIIIKVKTPSKLSDRTHWCHIGFRYVIFTRNHYKQSVNSITDIFAVKDTGFLTIGSYLKKKICRT